MARCRIIKPEFWDDERLSSISFQARLTYIGIWNFCDDYGVTKASSLWLKSRIYPYDDKLSMKEFEKWLSELRNLRRIVEFKHNAECFIFIPNFLKHQVINKPSKTRYPEPPDNINDGSRSTTVALPAEIEIEVEREVEIERDPVHECSGIKNVEPKNGDGFEIFWSTYPKKRSKAACLKIWKDLKRQKILPAIGKIIESVESQKRERVTLKERGAFCPEWKDPERWLKKECWTDEPQQSPTDDCPYGFDRDKTT